MKGDVDVKKIKRGTEPYFKTLGERDKTYIVVGYKDGDEYPLGEGFKTLKQARMFNNEYAHDNPEWLNENGDISEFNVKDNRENAQNRWHGNATETAYSKYTDFKDWNK
ncbi:hypothetical protein CN384_25850 [Bacillus thuringiensis]|nr:hypothetical protein [Bacillus cereus]PFA22352.1 hypothetical protein CN384_25850 [Bacillus thuringiensis]PGN16884.1 hypothetical protein CN951_25200 [Bacillus thuringiensis]PGQ63366.1 hypothetical protein COA16_02205 [Bacillus thuringiensis]